MIAVALIVAAGKGSRLQHSLPKAYVKVLADITVLELTIENFARSVCIDAVKVVIAEDHIGLYEIVAEKMRAKGYSSKLLPYVLGGESRQDSVRLGLKSLEILAPRKVLIHDAARPFVANKIIIDILYLLDTHVVVDVGLPVVDVVRCTDNMSFVLERGKLYHVQTPQGFEYETILDLHKKFRDVEFYDDVGLCIYAGLSPVVVKGSKENIKITHPEDLHYARWILNIK
ncbi:hypothetical protein MIDIC_250004 [Alphaproteobacteria bacterium]